MNGNEPQLGDKHTYLARKETAEYPGKSASRLTQHPRYIPHHKFGSHVLYIKEELDDIIRSNKHGV
jgi:hypothetical protein